MYSAYFLYASSYYLFVASIIHGSYSLQVSGSASDMKKYPVGSRSSDNRAAGAIPSNSSQSLGNRVANNVPDSILMPPPPPGGMVVPTSVSPVSQHSHVLQSGQYSVSSEQRPTTVITNSACHTCIASPLPSSAPSFQKCCSKGHLNHACHLNHPQLVQGQHPAAVLRNLPTYPRVLPLGTGSLDSVKEKSHQEPLEARPGDSLGYVLTGRYSTSSASDLSSPPGSPGTTPPDTPSMQSTQDEAEDWDRGKLIY